MQQQSVDVVLIVDQKWRDLPGMAALAVWLEDGFGISTELVSYTQWRRCLFASRPQAIVVTHMNGPRNRAIADVASRMGTRVVVIQTEGRPGNAEAMEYAVGKSAEIRGVDLWFTWSDIVRNYMLEEKTLPPEKIIVGGVHRFDFYRSPLNQLLSSRVDFARVYGLDPEKPIISWATNFTHARYVHRNRDFLVRDWKALGLLKLPSFSNPLDYARLDHEARERSLAAMKELLRARQDLQIALKPHPHEDHDRYVAFVKNCRAEFGPRMAFIQSRYIWDLLNAADVHVQRLCMTGIESWFLNKPCIELHLLDYYSLSLDQPGATTEAVLGNDLARDAQTLIHRLDYYLGGGSLPPEQQKARDTYIRRWFYRVDGQRTRAHAGALADLVKSKRVIRRPRLDLPALKSAVGVGVNRAIGRSVYAPLRFWKAWRSGNSDGLGQVDNYISEEDVRLWQQRLRKVLLPEINALAARNGETVLPLVDGTVDLHRKAGMVSHSQVKILSKTIMRKLYQSALYPFTSMRARRIAESYTAHYLETKEVYGSIERPQGAPLKSLAEVRVDVFFPGEGKQYLSLPFGYLDLVDRLKHEVNARFELSRNCIFFPKLNVSDVPEKIADVASVKKGEVIALQLRSCLDVAGLEDLCALLLPQLERNVYGSYLLAEKVYIYRNLVSRCDEQISWIWHYDNHPSEILKIMIYLSDVDEQHGPFEYLGSSYTCDAKLIEPTPLCGYGRIPAKVLQRYLADGHKSYKVIGPRGTVILFDNNIVHRANIAKKGIRDAIVLQVRPSLFHPPRYLDPEWTGSFPHVDFNPDPYDYQQRLK